jgi:hypothetical protein
MVSKSVEHRVYFFLVSLSLCLCANPVLGHGTVRSRAERGIYDVSWESPAGASDETLPLGNGDMAANVWVDATGTLGILLSKSDAWSGDGRLLKLGAVAVTVLPSSLLPGRGFRSTLHVGNATITVANDDGMNMKMWVDANSNVLHVKISCASGCEVQTKAEFWRVRNRPFMAGEAAAAHGSTCPQHVRGVRGDSVVEQVTLLRCILTRPVFERTEFMLGMSVPACVCVNACTRFGDAVCGSLTRLSHL